MFDIPNVRAQQQNPTPAHLEFYSGYVTELAPDHVVVTRSLTAKGAEKRSFKIGETTKIEGHLHARARVTVGYTTSDDGDLAMQIIVREPTPKKKS